MKRFLKRLLVGLAICGLTVLAMGSTCRVRPGPAPVEPRDTAYCAAACDKLRVLGCPEGEDLSDGTTCETFCVDTQKSGHALRPLCVINMKTCADLNECTKASREVFE